MRAQALADHLVENLVDDEYMPLSTYFPDEKFNSIEEVVPDDHPLPFALLGYHTTVCTSVGATPYLLVYRTEVVILAEAEIPSLRIMVESEIEDTEWVKTRLEQLMLIDEKRLASVCFGQLYQQRMARAYNKKVCPRQFEVLELKFSLAIGNKPEEEALKQCFSL
uniref:Uncharacterized protein LOC104236676 n=1 Tax=Nicotiana sylvestris TaxID=4096 RepID=A0A1U7XDL0_NICSY|nr:PREDICTED: uncharacterized protein LOC104236676 [Nicotiana sylvestris]